MALLEHKYSQDHGPWSLISSACFIVNYIYFPAEVDKVPNPFVAGYTINFNEVSWKLTLSLPNWLESCYLERPTTHPHLPNPLHNHPLWDLLISVSFSVAMWVLIDMIVK